MSIKSKKAPTPFVCIPNHIAQDPNISPVTKAVILYLESKPSGWIAHPYDIKKNMGFGDHIWRKVSKELKELGFIQEAKEQSCTKLYWVGVWGNDINESHTRRFSYSVKTNALKKKDNIKNKNISLSSNTKNKESKTKTNTKRERNIDYLYNLSEGKINKEVIVKSLNKHGYDETKQRILLSIRKGIDIPQAYFIKILNQPLPENTHNSNPSGDTVDKTPKPIPTYSKKEFVSVWQNMGYHDKKGFLANITLFDKYSTLTLSDLESMNNSERYVIYKFLLEYQQ